MKLEPDLQADLERLVTQALAEDLGSGDITAQLIPAHTRANARIITREAGVLCGSPWAEAERIMLDNFSGADIRAAVELRGPRNTELEVSGNIDETSLMTFAAAGVDFISSGALTKHLRALDLSFQLLPA